MPALPSGAPTGRSRYQQHVDEITTHCAGVVAGTDTVCPYLCFASFEVRRASAWTRKSLGNCHVFGVPPLFLGIGSFSE